MQFNVNSKRIETNEQGFLYNLDDWSEELAEKIADHDGVTLYNDHWELIWYFRDYHDETLVAPTMHTVVKTLGKNKGDQFRQKKDYEKHIYRLFPTDPAHEICKLAGLPMPQPDT
ncbi:MAG: TusE/DsrC/DsvC family sulfur relay protein [Gammaproteobacteria bacterium]|nr:TusE/DsrC/DsvC family sulfur relay protein [Gammaproteobacteria bacterium]